MTNNPKEAEKKAEDARGEEAERLRLEDMKEEAKADQEAPTAVEEPIQVCQAPATPILR